MRERWPLADGPYMAVPLLILCQSSAGPKAADYIDPEKIVSTKPADENVRHPNP